MVKFLLKIGLVLILLNTINCSPQTFSDKAVTPLRTATVPLTPDERYQEIRSRWTIRLNPAGISAGRPVGLPFPSREPGGGGGMFPLMITATLMVDTVVDAGLLYYESMAGMTPQQTDSFSQAYRHGNQVDEYLLIEVSLQTSSAENYLDLNRYTIFSEDDQHNKYEPAKIVQQPVSTHHLPGIMPGPDRKQPGYTDWTQHQKTVFLYFPRKDFYGKPMMHADMKDLKIVFILEIGGMGRVEGKWIFPR